MTKKERAEIRKYAKTLSDEALEAEYYKSVYESLGSKTERMYELGYDIQDIEDQDKFEMYSCERSDVLGMICEERGIELWKKESNEEADAPEDFDAHSCRAEADAYGYCQVCGAIVHGSAADYEEHGYDPPGTY